MTAPAQPAPVPEWIESAWERAHHVWSNTPHGMLIAVPLGEFEAELLAAHARGEPLCTTCGKAARDASAWYCSNGIHAPRGTEPRLKIAEAVDALRWIRELHEKVTKVAGRAERHWDDHENAIHDIRTRLSALERAQPAKPATCKTCGGTGSVSRGGSTSTSAWVSSGPCPDCPPAPTSAETVAVPRDLIETAIEIIEKRATRHPHEHPWETPGRLRAILSAAQADEEGATGAEGRRG